MSTCSARPGQVPTIARLSRFTISSVFSATDKPTTRSALLTPNWRGCEGTAPRLGARKTHWIPSPYLRSVTARSVSAVSADPTRPETGQGEGGQGGASAPDARSNPEPGAMSSEKKECARPQRTRLLLSRSKSGRTARVLRRPQISRKRAVRLRLPGRRCRHSIVVRMERKPQ